MTELVVSLSSDKNNWEYVLKLIEDFHWESVFVITDKSSANNFKSKKDLSFIIVDPSKPLVDLSKDVLVNLKDDIQDIEVAANFVSGSGKLHMALMSALLKIGLGVRFVALKPNGFEEI